MERSEPTEPALVRTRRHRLPTAAFALVAVALVTAVTGCSKGGDESTTTTTAKVLETISTLATTTTDDPTNPKPTTSRAPTTTAPTTAPAPTVATLNGTVTVKPSSVANTYDYDTTGALGTTPVLAWDVKVDAGQKVSVHGPAPGTADAELSTVATGSFPLCPGSLVGTTCTLDQKSYTWTVDVKNPDGTVVASKTATLRVSG